ncbi:Gfo/Idh/MocA family oxidoreductase [Microcella alkalica]|uniref:Putative dehydrogenase n=1 Tax=Microcella alkalica TaxID=355930 RepID=A0A839E835_9MICO|nr:Gfo/Idh/MocA family oxidoreductase [Microcella alkalica]MBA8847930.1 putative dehydrogenase [Microcella alkalica]
MTAASGETGARRPLRVAVIGCGDISALHFDALTGLDGVALVAVCDTDPGRLAATVAEQGVPGFASVAELLDAASTDAMPLDAVHVTTPHQEHASVAIAALERGIHVLLEKPLAHSRADAALLLAAAEASTATLGVCFQNRYNTPVQAAKAILDSGELGAIRGIAATVLWHRAPGYYRDRPWRGQWATGGGGLLMNQAIHTLDLVQWFGGPVVQAQGHATTRALADVIEVEDTAEVALVHENGARSVLYATLAHSTNLPVTIDVELERGSLSIRGALTVTRADGSTEVVEERGAAEGARSYWGVSHELLIADFYRGLESSIPFWIDGREALTSLEIIQKVYDQTYPERGALPSR